MDDRHRMIAFVSRRYEVSTTSAGFCWKAAARNYRVGLIVASSSAPPSAERLAQALALASELRRLIATANDARPWFDETAGPDRLDG